VVSGKKEKKQTNKQTEKEKKMSKDWLFFATLASAAVVWHQLLEHPALFAKYAIALPAPKVWGTAVFP
jgi:hypothetical protein